MPAALVALAAQPEEVRPGDEASCVVVVRNETAAPDAFAVSVHGPASPWATLDDGVVHLAGGEEGSVWIRFRPPDAPTTLPGAVPFSVRVVSSVDSSFVAIEAAVIRVARVGQLDADLVLPARPTRRSPRRLRVENRGNVTVNATVVAPALAGVELAIEPAEVSVGPGEAVELTVLVDVDARASRRRRREAELRVRITSTEAEPVELHGVIVLDPPVGQEVVRAGLVLGIALLAAVVGGQMLMAPTSKSGAPAGESSGLRATSLPTAPGDEEEGDDGEDAGTGDDAVEEESADDEPVVVGAPAAPTTAVTEASSTTTALVAAVPGSGQVVYSRAGDLYAVDATGSSRRLTQGPPQDRMPSLAPDGRGLLFVRDGDVHVAAPGSGQPGSGQSRRLVVGALWPTWSPDGSRFAYVQNGRIRIAAGDGSAAVDTAGEPDGRISWGAGRIVYTAGGDIWTLDPEGGAPARLTATPASERDPAASPDGRSIVYSSGGSLWMVAGGGAPVRVADGPTDGPAAWSPDASQLVFRRGSDSYLYVVGVDGSGFGRVEAASVADVDAPAWGPAAKE